jgi:hypothetical protein
MAGKVVVSTLNNDTGVLATQNGMTGIAKAWIQFDGTGTPSIRASFNVSSITDNADGNYTINFTTAMPNANYACIPVAGNTAGSTSSTQITGKYTGTKTTSACQVMFQQGAGGVDLDNNAVAFFSS